MTGRPRNLDERLEHAPLGAGLTLMTLTALAVTALAFVGLSYDLAVAAAIAGAALLICGLLLHFGVRWAQRRRNDRHREWLASIPPSELSEFRADVDRREEKLVAARGDWVRPIVAALAIMVSAIIVPYQLIGSHTPNALVSPLTTVWIVLALALGLFCLATAIIAALHDGERPTGPARRTVGGTDAASPAAAVQSRDPAPSPRVQSPVPTGNPEPRRTPSPVAGRAGSNPPHPRRPSRDRWHGRAGRPNGRSQDHSRSKQSH